MEIIKKVRIAILNALLKLNTKQRESIASSFDKIAVGIVVSIIFKLVTDEKGGDGLLIFLWTIYAIMFKSIEIAILAIKDEEE